jgi:hypothetical protein
METRFGHRWITSGCTRTTRRRRIGARDRRARLYPRRAIAFAAGEYRPESPAGRHCSRDELAHVIQQSGADERADPARPRHRAPRRDQDRRTLSEKDIKDAIAFNKNRIKNKKLLGEIRDVVGVPPGQRCRIAFCARGRALAGGHGVARTGSSAG